MKSKMISYCSFAGWVLLGSAGIIQNVFAGQPPPQLGVPLPGQVSFTYSGPSDWAYGTAVGIDTGGTCLKLATTPTTVPFIWVPNENDSVSKVDTRTGRELGRYYTGPPGVDGEPSRTTIDKDGNCWVCNRYSGTIIKIGLSEAGICVDRNGNGVMDTSYDKNGDGNITPDEMLPFGQDECVLFEVVVIPGYEGTYVPGTYAGPYMYSWGYPGPRSIGTDKFGNAWVGTYDTLKFFYIDGNTGSILRSIDVAVPAYGAVVDQNGVIWSSSQSYNHILKITPDSVHPATGPVGLNYIDLGHFLYGLGLDFNGHVFAAGWESSRLARINQATATIDWDFYDWRMYQGRGVAVTPDNDVWVVSSYYGWVLRFDNNGTYKATIGGMNQPTGIAIDYDGKPWVCDIGSENIYRINPTLNAIDLTKQIIGSGGHYSYSDMTGLFSRNEAANIGTWTTVLDAGTGISAGWISALGSGSVPSGTSLEIRVRSSNDQASWSAWELVGSNPLKTTPPGRFLQTEVKLQRPPTGGPSPELCRLSLIYQGSPPVLVCTPVANRGYYKIEAGTDSLGLPPRIFVKDSNSTFAYGPIPSGTIVRIIKSKTGVPKVSAGKAPASVTLELKGNGIATAVDSTGLVSVPVVLLPL